MGLAWQASEPHHTRRISVCWNRQTRLTSHLPSPKIHKAFFVSIVLSNAPDCVHEWLESPLDLKGNLSCPGSKLDSSVYLRASHPNLLPRYPHVRPDSFEQLFSCIRVLRVQVSLSPCQYGLYALVSEPRPTAASHLRKSSLDQVAGSPLGSGCAGNMSPPQMAHTATPVTKPVKASRRQHGRRRVVLGGAAYQGRRSGTSRMGQNMGRPETGEVQL